MCVREERRERKEDEEDRGHVASCYWVKRDDKIFLSQSGNDTWQKGDYFIFKAPKLYELKNDPILLKSYRLLINI